MSFPTSPTNGQQASINGITYTYSSALTAWTVSTSVSNSFVSISVAGNVNSGNLLATGTVSVTGNITGGNVLGGANVNATTHTGTTVLVTGNITGGNVLGGANVNATTHTGTTVSVTGNITGGNTITTGLTQTATFSVTGNVIGNLLPSANITYDLGSSTQRWRDLWLSGTTIQLGAASISSSGDSVSLGGGNISGNYVFGNGSQLTSIVVFVKTVAYPGSATAADPAGGETITVTGTGFNSGITAYINSTSCATTYGNSTSLTFATPATSVGTYNVSLYNTDGTTGTKPGGIVFSPIPVWVTASGALSGGSQNIVYSTSVSATGDTITYSVTTGSLPTGLSLNASTGAITGTPTVLATSTFSITATDAQNQGVARSFSITITNVVSAVEYLVVAGGGGGGFLDGGGGGGGGYRTAANFAVAPGIALTVTVGSGGAGSSVGSSKGVNGSDSIFSSITSTGGGGGGSHSTSESGASGGSGGGASHNNSSQPAGAGTVGQGFAGGTGYAGGGGTNAGGGGGGASEIGNTNEKSSGGDGLVSSITGSSVTYAGGGGGGMENGIGGVGGGGGGGHGSYNSAGSGGTNGTTNTGGGGGGGGYSGSGGNGFTGGSGIVIIRYSDTFPAATSTTGSPTITTAGGYRVYVWTASGTITF